MVGRIRSRVALAGVALLVAACSPGGVPSMTPAPTPTQAPSPTPTAATAAFAELMDAVATTIATGTARIEQSVSAEGSSVIPDFKSDSFTGQASLGTDHRMYTTGDYTELLGIGQVEMIVDGTLLYLGGELADAITNEADWVLVDLESDDPAAAPFLGLASGQNDLSMSVYYLLGMSEDVEVTNDNEGPGGARRRFTGEIDLEAARDRIPDANAEALENIIAIMRLGGMPRQFEGAAWVRDGLIEEVRFTFDLGNQQGGGTMTSRIKFSDFGEPLDYEIPDESDVIRIEDVDASPPPSGA